MLVTGGFCVKEECTRYSAVRLKHCKRVKLGGGHNADNVFAEARVGERVGDIDPRCRVGAAFGRSEMGRIWNSVYRYLASYDAR